MCLVSLRMNFNCKLDPDTANFKNQINSFWKKKKSQAWGRGGHTRHPSFWKIEAEESGTQSHSLCRISESSLGYTTPCLQYFVYICLFVFVKCNIKHSSKVQLKWSYEAWIDTWATWKIRIKLSWGNICVMMRREESGCQQQLVATMTEALWRSGLTEEKKCQDKDGHQLRHGFAQHAGFQLYSKGNEKICSLFHML